MQLLVIPKKRGWYLFLNAFDDHLILPSLGPVPHSLLVLNVTDQEHHPILVESPQ